MDTSRQHSEASSQHAPDSRHQGAGRAAVRPAQVAVTTTSGPRDAASTAPAPSPSTGRNGTASPIADAELAVTVCSASHLLARSHRGGGVFKRLQSRDTSSPYVRVFVDDVMVGETPVAPKTLCPSWHHEVPASVTSSSVLRFEVLDCRKVSKHEPMGRCSLRVADVCALRDGGLDTVFETRLHLHGPTSSAQVRAPPVGRTAAQLAIQRITPLACCVAKLDHFYFPCWADPLPLRARCLPPLATCCLARFPNTEGRPHVVATVLRGPCCRHHQLCCLPIVVTATSPPHRGPQCLTTRACAAAGICVGLAGREAGAAPGIPAPLPRAATCTAGAGGSGDSEQVRGVMRSRRHLHPLLPNPAHFLSRAYSAAGTPPGPARGRPACGRLCPVR